MNDKWWSNAPCWQRQLFEVFEGVLVAIFQILALIMHIVGLLFCWDALLWRWYKTNVTIKVMQFCARILDRICEKVGILND